jgi:hypothetical protein
MEQARVLLSKLQPAMSMISDAAAQKRCDFGLDRNAGFELLLPHLGHIRIAAQWLALQGTVQLDAGDMKAFTDTQSQIARVATQPGQDEVLIGSLVGAKIGRLGMSQVEGVINDGVLTPDGAKDLIEALAPLRGDDPMHFAAASAREFEALALSLKRASEHRGRDRAFYRMFGVDPVDADGRDRPGPRELLANLPALKPIYDLFEQALREPDLTKAKALLAKAEQMADRLPAPASALKLFLPNFAGMLDRRDRFNDDLANLLKMLEAIAADPAAAARLTSPAVQWARVAARVCALPDETQRSVEALRSGAPELASEDRDRAIACLVGCDTSIFEAMRVAAACERKDLDFSKVHGLDAWPPLPTFGGLRGAARLAMLRARMLETDQALKLTDLALAAVAALASDPSQAASCTSAAIARELVPAIADVARRPDMNEDRRARLDASVARIDRRDAFGFRASLAAERARVSERLRPLDDDSERFDRDLRRRNAEWVMAARIELERMHAPIENPGALESIDDLFPAVRLTRARTSSETIAELLQARAQDATAKRAPPKGRNPLAALPIEPIRDPATDATEAQATLSAIDAALKPTTASR